MMKQFGKWALVAFAFGIFNTPIIAQEYPTRGYIKNISTLKAELATQQEATAALEAEFAQNEQTYNKTRLNYLKIKSASRGWIRRNKAEDAYMQSYDAYHASKLSHQLAAQALHALTAKVNALKKHQKTTTRLLAQVEEKPFGGHFQMKPDQMLFTLLAILFVVILPITLIFADLLTSMVGWFIIKLRKLYDRADTIEVAGIMGKVKKIGLFKTTLLEMHASSNPYFSSGKTTGHIIYLPNHLILKHPLYNHTQG